MTTETDRTAPATHHRTTTPQETPMTIDDLTAANTTTDRKRPWSTKPLVFVLGVAGVLAVLIGLVTPWLDATVDRAAADPQLEALLDEEIEDEYGSEHPMGATLADGWKIAVLTAGFVALVAVHFKRDRRGRTLPLVAFALAALVALSGFGNIDKINTDNDDLQRIDVPAELSPAIGLYVTILGSALLLASAAHAAASAEKKEKAPAGSDVAVA